MIGARPVELEVDGGVKGQHRCRRRRRGRLVAGSAVFGTTDYAATIAALRRRPDVDRIPC